MSRGVETRLVEIGIIPIVTDVVNGAEVQVLPPPQHASLKEISRPLLQISEGVLLRLGVRRIPALNPVMKMNYQAIHINRIRHILPNHFQYHKTN